MKKHYLFPKQVICCAIIAVFTIIVADIPSGFSENLKDPWETTPLTDKDKPLKDKPPKGKIEKPDSGSKVSRHFFVSGTASGTYRHLWLTVYIGNRYWPKEPKLIPNKNGNWKGEVHEGGKPPQGIFELLLVDVSEETSIKIQNWLEAGHRTGSYPGMHANDLGNMIELDRKTYELMEP